MSAFKDFSAMLIFDVFRPVVKHLKSQQMVVIAFFQNGDNDYGCIQIKLNLKDCDASHCD